MTKLTNKEWISLTEKTIENRNDGQRLGQAYMNALFIVNPIIYNDMKQSESDCFYDDNKLINFINYLNK